MHLHVSNLSLNLLESDLRRLFTPFGEIKSVLLVRDQLNNRSRGTAVIDMPVDKEGKQAASELDGTLLMGKLIKVAEVGYDPNFRSESIHRHSK